MKGRLRKSELRQEGESSGIRTYIELKGKREGEERREEEKLCVNGRKKDKKRERKGKEKQEGS